MNGAKQSELAGALAEIFELATSRLSVASDWDAGFYTNALAQIRDKCERFVDSPVKEIDSCPVGVEQAKERLLPLIGGMRNSQTELARCANLSPALASKALRDLASEGKAYYALGYGETYWALGKAPKLEGFVFELEDFGLAETDRESRAAGREAASKKYAEMMREDKLRKPGCSCVASHMRYKKRHHTSCPRQDIDYLVAIQEKEEEYERSQE